MQVEILAAAVETAAAAEPLGLEPLQPFLRLKGRMHISGNI